MTTMLRRFRQARAQGADAGITLIELMVSMLVMGVVFVVLGNVLINSVNGQRKIVDLGQAGNDAQVEMASMQRVVRNSAEGGLGTPGGSNTLVANTWIGSDGTPGSGWRCQAWVFIPGATTGAPGRIYTKVSPPAADSASAPFNVAALAALGTAPADWRLAVDSVLPSLDPAGADLPVFAVVPVAASPTTSTATMQFRSMQGQTDPPGAGVVANSSATQRKQEPTPGVCF